MASFLLRAMPVRAISCPNQCNETPSCNDWGHMHPLSCGLEVKSVQLSFESLQGRNDPP